MYYKFLCIARKHLVCSGLDSGLGTWREWNLACVWVSQLAEEKLMGIRHRATVWPCCCQRPYLGDSELDVVSKKANEGTEAAWTVNEASDSV